MSRIIDYLYELDLTSLEKIEDYFQKNDIDTIVSFNEYVGELAFEDWHIADYSPYSFAPSMDVSGFGGCAHLGCKIQRANKFIKFSSLYSDHIYLIVNSITNPHLPDPSKESMDQYRDDLLQDYSLILMYSDLVNANIARIIPAHFAVCPECFSNHICDISDFDRLTPLVEQYASKAIMEVTEYFHDADISFLRLSNLSELFPDHDMLFSIQGGEISNLCKKISSYPFFISDKELIYGFVKEHIYKEYLTSKFETFISSSYQSKYITTKPSDKVLIESNCSKTIGSTPPPVFEMPFLDNISSRSILELRKSEQPAFNEYRVAIDQATKLYVSSSSKAEITDIYDDVIYPAFVKIDAAFERAKRIHTLKNLCEAIVVCSTVTLGVINSTIPPDPAAIVAAAGGSEALLSYLGNVIERKINSGNEIEKQDFYFLWKLQKRMK